jgi:hypothetical protein
MKRDMDIIRRIVLAARDEAAPVRGLEGVDADVFAEHVRLLEEAGLVGASVRVVQQRADVALVWRLTWSGHEFADAISSDTLWNKAKDNVIKPAGSWTFGVLLDYLKSEISRGIPSLPF